MASLNIYGQSIWLVVWNILIFPYIGNNHPNWREYVSEGLKPPTRYLRLDKLYSPVGKLLDTPIVFCCQWSSWWDGGLLRGTIVNLCTMVKLLIVQKKGGNQCGFTIQTYPNIFQGVQHSVPALHLIQGLWLVNIYKRNQEDVKPLPRPSSPTLPASPRT